MFYFWTKGSKNFQNFFIPNFQIVYIYVFSAPRTLIAIFCLFSCFLLVIRSRTGIGSAAWGACTGPFFSVVMFCWVRAHTCSCPRLKKQIRQTQRSCLQSTCVVGNCRCRSTPGRQRTIKICIIWQHKLLNFIPNLMFCSTAQKLSLLAY